MKRTTYRTRGREELLRYLSSHPDRHFSAAELCTAVNGDESSGKSSIYRLLSRLVEEGAVRRFRSACGQNDLYQYVGSGCDCSHHFHQKCTSCGRLEHLDCSDSGDFAAHLLREHGFAVDCGQSILYGLCADCLAREERK